MEYRIAVEAYNRGVPIQILEGYWKDVGILVDRDATYRIKPNTNSKELYLTWCKNPSLVEVYIPEAKKYIVSKDFNPLTKRDMYWRLKLD